MNAQIGINAILWYLHLFCLPDFLIALILSATLVIGTVTTAIVKDVTVCK